MDFSSHPVSTEFLKSSPSDSNQTKLKKESEALKDFPGVMKAQKNGEEKQPCFFWIPSSFPMSQALHKIQAIWRMKNGDKTHEESNEDKP